MGRKYPSELSNKEWKILAPLVPPAKPGGRPRSHPDRDILNAILYVNKTGCQWRMLPNDYPPWETVYYYFREWSLDGTWQRINETLVKVKRLKSHRNESPSLLIIDSQSVKTSEKGGTAVTMQASR